MQLLPFVKDLIQNYCNNTFINGSNLHNTLVNSVFTSFCQSIWYTIMVIKRWQKELRPIIAMKIWNHILKIIMHQNPYLSIQLKIFTLQVLFYHGELKEKQVFLILQRNYVLSVTSFFQSTAVYIYDCITCYTAHPEKQRNYSWLQTFSIRSARSVTA